MFQDAKRNFIVDRGLLDTTKKTESWRLGNETSEDALSWNVFVGLMRLGLLGAAVQVLSGVSVDREPHLYLWGNEIREREMRDWSLLGTIREQLEPGFRIQTEPDVALHVPGQLLVLVEAKFGSRNCTLDKKKYERVGQFLEVYVAPEGGADPLDRGWIMKQPPGKIFEQLCRLAVLGSWMRKADERIVIVNLVRQTELAANPPAFGSHLVVGGPVKFEARAWEQLIPLANGARNQTLARYLEKKSYCLRPAFAKA